MFEDYVETATTLEKYCHAPLANERQRFLVHLRQSGHSYTRVQHINVLLLAIAQSINRGDHRMVSRVELSAAADRWVAQRTRPETRPRSAQVARTDFISIGSKWLRFLGRLKDIPAQVPFADQFDAFLRHIRDERGLSQGTVRCRRRSLEVFFLWLSSQGASIEAVTPELITRYFTVQKARRWKRATIKFHVYTLRSFFRYAGFQNWCDPDLAATIDGPRMYAYEHLPQGPAWTDVQRLIASLSGNHPTQIRSRAAVLLLALYGFRAGEVTQLTLDDLDWTADRIRLRRSKQRKSSEYPLTTEVGEAILRYKFVPYLYSVEEVRQLLSVPDSCYHPRSLMEPHTMRTLLVLLYGTGLRIGEAIRLKLSDVDLVRGILTVRETKFYKSRLVPVGSDLQSLLQAYYDRQWADRNPDLDMPFLCTKKHAPLTIDKADDVFQWLRREAGILRFDAGCYQPRLHDFRHTFAVTRLVAWYREGKDVQRLLPHLATYLGHVHIDDTAHYLTITKELLQEANRCFESYALSEVQHA